MAASASVKLKARRGTRHPGTPVRRGQHRRQGESVRALTLLKGFGTAGQANSSPSPAATAVAAAVTAAGQEAAGVVQRPRAQVGPRGKAVAVTIREAAGRAAPAAEEVATAGTGGERGAAVAVVEAAAAAAGVILVVTEALQVGV